MALPQRAAATVSGGLFETIGETIAVYRRRRRQMHRDVPWSQDDLAVASGLDQAHVSRIESNRQHPTYPTLVRICDALELSPADRTRILGLAGYRVAQPLPDDDAVTTVLAALSPFLDSCPYPVVLLDESERQWYLNDVAVTLWGQCFQASNQGDCLARIRGRRIVELIFDLELYAELLPQWEATYEDIELVLTRNINLFWRAYSAQMDDPEMGRILARLGKNPDFLRRWERLGEGEHQLIFIDHATYVTRHQRFGRLQWHAWRTRVAVDERFIACHFTPIDANTSIALGQIVEARQERH